MNANWCSLRNGWLHIEETSWHLTNVEYKWWRRDCRGEIKRETRKGREREVAVGPQRRRIGDWHCKGAGHRDVEEKQGGQKGGELKGEDAELTDCARFGGGGCLQRAAGFSYIILPSYSRRFGLSNVAQTSIHTCMSEVSQFHWGWVQLRSVPRDLSNLAPISDSLDMPDPCFEHNVSCIDTWSSVDSHPICLLSRIPFPIPQSSCLASLVFPSSLHWLLPSSSFTYNMH